jgi:hypothetical protein
VRVIIPKIGLPISVRYAGCWAGRETITMRSNMHKGCCLRQDAAGLQVTLVVIAPCLVNHLKVRHDPPTNRVDRFSQ